MQKEEATLERRDPSAAADAGDEAWIGVAARAVDVAEHLGPVLQLTREQFLQVILLAQGRFQEFLRAKNDDRIALLRALFGTERFERFEAELAGRARALAEVVGTAAKALDADLARLAELASEEAPDGAGTEWALAVAERAAAAAATADAAVVAAQAALADADRAAAEAVAVAALQARRDQARAALERLDAERPQVERAIRRRDDAVRVLPVLPELDRAARARSAMATAAATLQQAQAALPGLESDPAAAADRTGSLLGALDAPLAEERALPDLLAAADRAELAVRAARAEQADAEQAAAAFPERRSTLLATRGVASDLAALEPERGEALTRARAAATAARAAASMRQQADTAAVALLSALDAERAAGDRVRAVVAARSANAAGLLAAMLHDGEACAVCGSTTHPAPASHTDAVGDEDVELAQTAQDAAVATRVRAAQADSGLRSTLATAIAESEGSRRRTPESAVAGAVVQLGAARGRPRDRRAGGPGARRPRSRGAHDHRGDRDRTCCRRDRAETATSARTAATASGSRVEQARAGAESVALRVAALRERSRLLRALVSATAASESAGVALEDAEAAAEHALEDAGIPDEETARAVALPAAERLALEERLQRHAEARAAANATLRGPRGRLRTRRSGRCERLDRGEGAGAAGARGRGRRPAPPRSTARTAPRVWRLGSAPPTRRSAGIARSSRCWLRSQRSSAATGATTVGCDWRAMCWPRASSRSSRPRTPGSR